jgi:hypothetical protein
MYVKCIKGYPGYLNEGDVYSVKKITENGNYILYGASPPYPYTSFDKNRFEEINLDAIVWDPEYNLVENEL